MRALTKKASCDWTEDSCLLTITPNVVDKFHFPFIQEMGDLRTGETYYAERDGLPSYLLVYTVGGCGCLTYENRQYVLRAGDLFLIDCMKFQRYQTDPVLLWHLRFVHFFGGTSERYYQMFAAASRPVVHIPPESSLPDCLERILRDCRPGARDSDLLAAMYLVELMTELILIARSAAAEGRFSYAGRIAQYLDDHLAEKITLEQLAREFSLGKTYLPKKFKAQFGISPTEYLARARVRKAKEYLHNTDYSVGRIAELVGIDDPSYFIRLFRRHELLTPNAYRSKWSLR